MPVDYDLTDIPATYDCGHDHGSTVLDQWMAVIESHTGRAGIHRILDLACGTGRFSAALADHFQATVIGLDPSWKMLRQVPRISGGVSLALGNGEALPLRAQSIDMVFMSMVFHHFEDPVRVALECGRVLRPGGCVFLRTITSDQIANYPYVPFFPASRRLLEERLPSVDDACTAFRAASLRTLFAGIVVQEIAPDLAVYAEKLSAGADTTLAMPDRRDFDAGLKSMLATHRAGAHPAAVSEPIDFIVFGKT